VDYFEDFLCSQEIPFLGAGYAYSRCDSAHDFQLNRFGRPNQYARVGRDLGLNLLFILFWNYDTLVLVFQISGFINRIICSLLPM